MMMMDEHELAPTERRDFYTDGLAEDCGYDPMEDTGIDSLIDYKDACEDTLDRIEGIIRETELLSLAEWLTKNGG